MSGHLVATGRRKLLAFGRETGWQQGGATLLAHDPVLPSGGRLRRGRIESPAVSRSGFKPRGTPGPADGPFPFEGLLTPGLALDFGLAVLGKVAKSEPVAGVYQYDFEPGGDEHADVSFEAVAGLPPHYRQRLYGIRYADWMTAVDPAKVATLKAAGIASHGTTIGPAEADPANLGTGRPRLRGVMADPSRGDIYLRIVQDVSGGGLTFELEISQAAPVWAGTFVYAAALAANGDHVWQNARDQDGLDIGPYDERKAPVELYLGDLDDYVAGDVYRFPAPGTWPTPALPTAGGRVFRGVHYEARLRRHGSADPWKLLERNSAELMLGTTLHESRGKPSDFISQLAITGDYMHSLKVVRDYTDGDLDRLYDQTDRLVEVEHGFRGRLLDAATETREQIWFSVPAMEITKLENAAGNAGVVPETIELQAVPDPAGGPTVGLRVITDIDWTP